jgi:3-oxoadipate enol-lactonase
MTTVSVGRVVADVAGEGFPVILVHGLGGTSNTFQPQLDVLRSFRVIRPDLPGSGRSPVPAEEQSIESLAKAIISTAQALGVTRAHFVGHSLGTLVCQWIAVDRPDLVASLALFGAILEPPEAARTGLAGRARLARTEGMEPIAEQIIAATVSAETRSTRPAAVAFVRETIMRQNPEGYAKTCEALAKAVAVDHRLIAAPALLVTGDADVVAPVGMARMLADKIGGATLSVLDRCGHWSTIEKPAECNERLGNFLRRVE